MQRQQTVLTVGQVEALVAGIGLFKGGYNATTGLTTDLGAANGSLDGASNIAIKIKVISSG